MNNGNSEKLKTTLEELTARLAYKVSTHRETNELVRTVDCFGTSLVLRDMLRACGFDAEVIAVSFNDTDHCVVKSGMFLCDATFVQFGGNERFAVFQ